MSTAIETGKPFVFNDEMKARADKIIARYPEGRQQSAVIPLLDLAQRQNDNWLSKEALEHVADVLSMAPIRVLEVATFYTMFNLKPVGKYLLQFCCTTPCWLRGSDDVLKATEKHLGIGYGQTTEDGTFTMMQVECLGACVNAPVVQVNDDLYEDLDGDSMVKLLDDLKAGKPPSVGTVIDRQTSAPIGGPTTLKGFTADATGDD